MIRAGKCRSLAPLTIAALAAACAISPPAALARLDAGAGNLSPRLAELAGPGLRSATPALQAEALSLAPSGPGSLLRRGDRVLVEVGYESGALAGASDLRAAGGEVVHASRRLQTVTVATTPADLWALSRAPRVAGVKQVLAPVTSGATCSGLVTSEGDTQLEAAAARENFGVDGSGVTVGILSDSFDEDAKAPTHAAEDVASGDLPGPGNPCGETTPVDVLDDSAPPAEVEDEGRAMAQIVHDLAPGAKLSFATAFNGEAEFADNIRALAKAGASVLVDDVSYFTEPFFQDGPVADAVNEVAASGVSYFSAAGNDNLIDAAGNDIASWEAPAFRDSHSCPPELEAAAKAEDCMDFDPGEGAGEVDDTFGITVSKGATLTVDLQWAEPWGGVRTDLDAYLLDSTGAPIDERGRIVGSTEDNVAGGTEEPVEVFAWENKTGKQQQVQLAINHCFGLECNEKASATATPRLKVALLENGSGVTQTEYPKSSGGDVVGPTVYGHAGTAGAIGVGAISFQTDSAPERYSSRGPVTHYFGPVDGTTPAAPLHPAVSIDKPDLIATDCGLTTFFVPTEVSGVYRFCGTSAAAPHAAAVAALIRQADPSITAAEVHAALVSTARPVGAFPPDAVGAGLIDAESAVASVATPPTVTITEPPAKLSSDRLPSIGFVANRPATFGCSLDGASFSSCASPFKSAKALADGPHRFVVEATDVAGRVGASETVLFTVDTKPPQTSFAHHPPRTIRTAKGRVRATFAFRSSEEGTFTCRIDRGPSHLCPAHIARRFALGRHVLSVRAVDGAGNVDPTPAVFHFAVKRAGP